MKTKTLIKAFLSISVIGIIVGILSYNSIVSHAGSVTKAEVEQAVEDAKYKMWLPFLELSKTGENPNSEPVWASTVQSKINEALTAKRNAQKLLDSYKGSDKKELQQRLYENQKYIDNAKEYIYARWMADDLLNKYDWDRAVQNAINGNLSSITNQGKKRLDYTEIRRLNNLYFDFDNEINFARDQIDKVWNRDGGDTRQALKDWFTEPAYWDHAYKIKNVAWAVHYIEKAEWWLYYGDNDPNYIQKCYTNLTEANNYLSSNPIKNKPITNLVMNYYKEIEDRAKALK